MKFIRLILIFLIVFSFFRTRPVFAKKSLFQKGGGSTGIIISPKLRNDRLALIVNFSNLNFAKSINYTLTYTSGGIAQGVSGTIIPTTTATSRELLFGTCSSGVCRYHTNLANMRFVITTSLKSGGRLVKTYRIKP